MLVGVLALQGDFAKHEDMLRSLGIQVCQVRTPQELEGCDALIIPGGESTVMLRQLDFIKMKEALQDFAQERPLFGTCAGLILMSSSVQLSTMKPLGLLDITVERNAYGRQVESFQASVGLHLASGHDKIFHAFFIRAPRIRANGEEVKVLASYQGEPILVRQGHLLGASFHPELTGDPTIHQYFLEMVREKKRA
ncbi:Glutamine amidotransferase [Candidatus Protochlamydia naegleriophila]|uniref:Pyridoxal 5'-phosphate synthase subunit PdxT n=1 Tax=Candidatus Protochlamydia naegleriophila TaxID=389348 RepID=A0A0U5EPD6_9BACT|nr:pyridoxal 5'-phosphate synthase glutaminase subunit PdxT [Candidatus Protochlamydia naegleriophila]CUI15888.1 Glutamine amidotransferase [Candidatus Protochlamydia naegleriophila]